MKFNIFDLVKIAQSHSWKGNIGGVKEIRGEKMVRNLVAEE